MYKGSEPALVSADAAGVVNRIAFRRVMWTAWVAEVCIIMIDNTHPLYGASKRLHVFPIYIDYICCM
jgi:hypothetical protein